MRDEPRGRVVAAERGDRLGDRPRAGAAPLLEGPLGQVELGHVQRLGGRPGGAAYGPRLRERPQRAHADLHAGVEDRLAAVGAEVVGGGREDEPADEIGVLAPDALGDHRAHRVAGDDRVLETELGDHRRDVVGAVVQREALGDDAAAVPALVEDDDPVALRELVHHREPGEHPGAADRVQQHDRRGAGRAGQLGEPGASTPGQLQPAALGDLDVGERDVRVDDPAYRRADAAGDLRDHRSLRLRLSGGSLD